MTPIKQSVKDKRKKQIMRMKIISELEMNKCEVNVADQMIDNNAFFVVYIINNK